MLYDAYEVQRSFLAGASKLAGLGAGWLNNPANPFSYTSMSPLVSAALDVFAHASAPRGKPPAHRLRHVASAEAHRRPGRCPSGPAVSTR